MATDPQVLKTIADLLARVEKLEAAAKKPKTTTRVTRIRPTVDRDDG